MVKSVLLILLMIVSAECMSNRPQFSRGGGGFGGIGGRRFGRRLGQGFGGCSAMCERHLSECDRACTSGTGPSFACVTCVGPHWDRCIQCFMIRDRQQINGGICGRYGAGTLGGLNGGYNTGLGGYGGLGGLGHGSSGYGHGSGGLNHGTLSGGHSGLGAGGAGYNHGGFRPFGG